MTDLQCDWSTRTVPELPTILVVPNVRPSQDSIVNHKDNHGEDHCVQAHHHECYSLRKRSKKHLSVTKSNHT